MRSYLRVVTRAVAGITTVALVAIGCSGDVVTGPTRDVQDIFWDLRFDHTTVTMAVGETLQLTATPLNVAGKPMTTLARPTYHSTDTLMVQVDSLGRLTAIGSGYMAYIVATLSSPEDEVTNVDTVFVNVNDVAVTVRSFTIQQPDSANVAVGCWTNINTDILDTDNHSVIGVLVHLRSSDPLRAAVDPYGSMEPKNVGPVTIYAEATIYGKKYIDSVKYNLTYPIDATVVFSNTDMYATNSPSYFQMPIINIVKGGSVFWYNTSTNLMDVTFDDTTNVEGGNIADIPNDDGAARVFPVPGTYNYRSTRFGSTGRVIVHP